jgi:hypothetical protein
MTLSCQIRCRLIRHTWDRNRYSAGPNNRLSPLVKYRVGHKSLDTSNLPLHIFVKRLMAHPVLICNGFQVKRARTSYVTRELRTLHGPYTELKFLLTDETALHLTMASLWLCKFKLLKSEGGSNEIYNQHVSATAAFSFILKFTERCRQVSLRHYPEIQLSASELRYVNYL